VSVVYVAVQGRWTRDAAGKARAVMVARREAGVVAAEF
jgi:hypothetical protein